MELMTIINETYELAKMLQDTNEYKKLTKLETIIQNSEIIELKNEIDYFIDNNDLTQNKAKIFETQKKIYENETYKKYIIALNEYNNLLLKIKKIIFKDLIKDDLFDKFRVSNDTLKQGEKKQQEMWGMHLL